jgi:hypothetical protein
MRESANKASENIEIRISKSQEMRIIILEKKREALSAWRPAY